MRQSIIKIFLLILIGFCIQEGYAQEGPAKGWDAAKIKGTRQETYQIYDGKPYLSDNWSVGKIQFTNGETLDSLYLKISSYKDELIYFNKQINTQIRIDKANVSSFSFTDEYGDVHLFRKQKFDNSARGERYFEVLDQSEPNLLCYRKVSLNETSPYRDQKGTLKNMAYEKEYLYYFYSPDNGYASVKPTKTGLLSRFDKESQRPIKKILRKNKIFILDEFTFIFAWQTIEKNGFKVIFQ